VYQRAKLLDRMMVYLYWMIHSPLVAKQAWVCHLCHLDAPVAQPPMLCCMIDDFYGDDVPSTKSVKKGSSSSSSSKKASSPSNNDDELDFQDL
jgi:hypothetical protein